MFILSWFVLRKGGEKMSESFCFNLGWPEVFILAKVLNAEFYNLSVLDRGLIKDVVRQFKDCEDIHLKNLVRYSSQNIDEQLSLL